MARLSAIEVVIGGQYINKESPTQTGAFVIISAEGQPVVETISCVGLPIGQPLASV